MMARLGTLAVLTHLVVVVLHGHAHSRLGVELNGFQTGYAAVVIVAAPLVAAALLWTGRLRLGAQLLFVSMLAARGRSRDGRVASAMGP
ncbi:MAG: hypothetical protein ACE5GX_19335, partial [Thermoanaerobaculia bacterium]